tara:strand:+ start:459 stop:947 length:489 start_codon:yes stop_codon:yes gene_type:complete
VCFFSNHNNIIAVSHKHIVVDVRSDSRKIGEIGAFKLVVHFHQKFHGQCIEEHVKEIGVTENAPQIEQIDEQVKSKFLKGVDDDNVAGGGYHFLAVRSVHNIIPQEKGFNEVKDTDSRHHELFLGRGLVWTHTFIVCTYLVRNNGNEHEPLRNKDENGQRKY